MSHVQCSARYLKAIAKEYFSPGGSMREARIKVAPLMFSIKFVAIALRPAIISQMLENVGGMKTANYMSHPERWGSSRTTRG